MSRSTGGRWSCSATRVPFSNASSPPCFSVSPARIREQRRLAGAVRAGERDTVAPLDAEGDAVEEDGSGDLLAEVGCDDDCHAATRVDSQACRLCSRSTSARPRSAPSASTSSGRARRRPAAGALRRATTRTRWCGSSGRCVGGRDEDADAVGTSCFGHSLRRARRRRPAADAGARLARHARAPTRRSGCAAVLDAEAVHARTGAPAAPVLLAGEARLARRDASRRSSAAPRASSPSPTTSTRSSRHRAATSVSIASGTGLLDLGTRGWDAELLEMPRRRRGAAPGISDEPHGAWYPA